MKRFAAPLLILLLAFTPAAFAADFETAMSAYEQHDFASALRRLRPLAEQGDARARFVLGMMYDKGEGTTRDDAEALRWLHLAAGQNYYPAQFNLGMMYAQGRGVRKDFVQAHAWWSLASRHEAGGTKSILAALEKRMTRAQIAEAKHLAAEWRAKHGK